MQAVSNRITKQVNLAAPVAQVWRVITDAREFGVWFGADFERQFVAGGHVTGHIAPTRVDAHVAKLQRPYEGATLELTIDRLEPQHLFSFRWHPFANDPLADYSQEEKTLVSFELQSFGDGTELTITEAGFDGLPPERRAAAFKANDAGWQHQARLIEKYLLGKAA